MQDSGTRSQPLLRFVTLGSVDDGKSTLVGRLLYDSNTLPLDVKKKIEASKVKSALNVLPDFSLVTDGLLAEQEQKITIDVAYRYFRTDKRVFILADSPGHEQYTRNMVTAASTASLALLLLDARKGVTSQTKRHAFIASLLGIKRLVVLVNKMDLVGYEQKSFQSIFSDVLRFSERLQFADIDAIPVSALMGDNVVHSSEKMPWYTGRPLLEFLENAYADNPHNPVDFRFPVQYVIRPGDGYRGFAGQVASGRVSVGDEVMVLPSSLLTRVKSIDFLEKESIQHIETIEAPRSVTIQLEKEIDVSRGDMIVRSGNTPNVSRELEATIIWFDETALNLSKTYLLQHCSRFVKVKVSDLRYSIQIDSLERQSVDTLCLNEIGRVHLLSDEPLYFDAYEKNRTTGSFILIDPDNYLTVAAGLLLNRKTAATVIRDPKIAPRSQHLHAEESKLSRLDREAENGHKAFTLWFTGLSGSGKSTLCRYLETALFREGKRVYWLDGDNIRNGLCRDLGFRREERGENMRRIAEVAKLFNDAGLIVLCSFITPYREDRELIREILGEEAFHLIYLSADLKTCEERDPNGLYAKARSGVIQGFTGIDAPYDVPVSADLTVDTGSASLEDCVEAVRKFILGI